MERKLRGEEIGESVKKLFRHFFRRVTLADVIPPVYCVRDEIIQISSRVLALSFFSSFYFFTLGTKTPRLKVVINLTYISNACACSIFLKKWTA